MDFVALMESSQSEAEWNANCDKVKAHFGGYPNDWFKKIIVSGLLGKIAKRWGSDGEIKIVAVKPGEPLFPEN